MHQQAEIHQDAGASRLTIRWLVDWQADGSGPDRSSFASIRYRVLLPMQALRSLGHDVDLVRLDELRRGRAPDWQGVNVVVVGKLFLNSDLGQFADDSGHLLRAALAARAAGALIVADINDDHFDKPVVGQHWQAAARLADICVVGSPAMGQAVARHTDRAQVAIGDPIGSPRSAPRVYADRVGAFGRMFRKEPLKLVWYGATDNLPAMEQWAMFVGAAWDDMPLLIRVVTRRHKLADALCAGVNERFGKKLRMDFLEWSEEVQWATVEESDVVLIPSDMADPRKAVKTANRLVDALHAGRYVIASPIPSYLPYADFVTLTANPVQALHDYLKEPALMRERIAGGQDVVDDHWGLEVVANEWLAVFRRPPAIQTFQASAQSVTSAATLREVQRPPASAPVRLNLGCGDKILDGYINVDVVESRAGKRPDVLSDLRDLSAFADASADEVMAIHVIEHFWRWEVEAVLREWIRILKPGGELVLECPNLEAACAEFLRDPDRASGPGPEGQMSMWVFYGDPSWKDPLMVHRWGYTPRSLGQLLEDAGLVAVRQEPAVYKKREPRDMRIVGRKPLAGVTRPDRL